MAMTAQTCFTDEITVDGFCGGGGWSTGFELAIGRPVDIGINHDAAAIALHKKNHPYTRHYNENIWEVDPRTACAGRPVGWAHFSPDCKHFSRAKGAKPVSKKIRGLAWVPTLTAKHGFGVVTPYIMCNNQNNVGSSPEEPVHTVTTGNRHFVACPTLIQYRLFSCVNSNIGNSFKITRNSAAL